MTALHIAAIRGLCEGVAILRHARANAKAKTDDGRKPIDLANAKNMLLLLGKIDTATIHYRLYISDYNIRG